MSQLSDLTSRTGRVLDMVMSPDEEKITNVGANETRKEMRDMWELIDYKANDEDLKESKVKQRMRIC